jgi:glycosyltransferase involved in cell wall biosynthesis
VKVAVVTPTIGQVHLKDCLESIQNQNYENVVHYVFLDGKEHYDKIHPMLYQASGNRTIKTVSLEDNVGKGWYGHRVYAACSYLVNADIIMYLDEDNWYEPNHVSSMVKTIEDGNLDWAFSLRKIHDKSGEFICNDNCESLGMWSPVDRLETHVDTSCFAVRRDVAVRMSPAWYAQWGADRQFKNNLIKYFNKYSSNKDYTLCYRLDGNTGSVSRKYFEAGNSIMFDRYRGDYPWLK